MSTLEQLPPLPEPTPVSVVVLHDAFRTLFTELANKPNADLLDKTVQQSIGEVHTAAHKIATWSTPFAVEALKCSGAFEDYYFERYGFEQHLTGKFEEATAIARFDRQSAEKVVKGVIQAYALSGLALLDQEAMVSAAKAFHRDWSWVKTSIELGTRSALGKLDKHDLQYRWNKQYSVFRPFGSGHESTCRTSGSIYASSEAYITFIKLL